MSISESRIIELERSVQRLTARLDEIQAHVYPLNANVGVHDPYSAMRAHIESCRVCATSDDCCAEWNRLFPA